MRSRTWDGIRRIALVGSGRWSQIIASVLIDLMPENVRIGVHTSRNAAGAGAWIAHVGNPRLELDGPFDSHAASRVDAVIVANRPHDHVKAAATALGAGVPTLVEKPLAVSESDACELIALAERRHLVLALSRVFVFARYVEAFARLVVRGRSLSEARVVWADVPVEVRHGIVKRYDAGVAVPNDTLPHVLSVLRALFGSIPQLDAVMVAHGGMQVNLSLRYPGVPVVVSLARNADARRRVIEVKTASGALGVDFSEEPGWLLERGASRNADPEWDSQPRPLARMLGAFFDSVVTGKPDPRLSADLAREECRLADEAMALYRQGQEEWLAARVGKPLDRDIHYALFEMAARTGSAEGLREERLEQIWIKMAELGVASVASTLAAPGQNAPFQ